MSLKKGGIDDVEESKSTITDGVSYVSIALIVFGIIVLVSIMAAVI